MLGRHTHHAACFLTHRLPACLPACLPGRRACCLTSLVTVSTRLSAACLPEPHLQSPTLAAVTPLWQWAPPGSSMTSWRSPWDGACFLLGSTPLGSTQTQWAAPCCLASGLPASLLACLPSSAARLPARLPVCVFRGCCVLQSAATLSAPHLPAALSCRCCCFAGRRRGCSIWRRMRRRKLGRLALAL